MSWVPRSVFVSPGLLIRDLFPGFLVPDDEPREPEFLGDLLVRPLPQHRETPPDPDDRNVYSFTIPMEEWETWYAPRKAGPETREQWLERTAAEAARRARVERAWHLFDAARAAGLMMRPGKVARVVWGLHAPAFSNPDRPSYPHCEGCDGYGDDYADWPCRTIAAVAGVLGVALPDHHDLEPRPEEDQ